MALEQLSLSAGPVDGGADGRQPSGDVTASAAAAYEGSKIARLPRWTRQEILVLIRGKRAAESRVRRVRSASVSGHAEPKWESVSSYCRRHGVNRGPVQCRKRWSNLAADFKKIKEWDSRARDETESFWAMRNDLRRERKLPGLFDREVFNILNGGGGEEEEEVEAGGELSLALAPSAAAAEEGGEEAEPEALFDSGRTAAADDGLFSDSEHPEPNSDPIEENPSKDKSIPDPISVSEEQDQTFRPESSGKDKYTEEQPEDQGSQEGKKRKRNTTNQEAMGTANLEHGLIKELDKNGELLSSLLESQNVQLQLDREQRDHHANGLLTVLNKLADALGRIADKL